MPKDRDEKLKRILGNLDKHHNAVRRNMIRLVALQKEKLVADARELLRIEEQNVQFLSATTEAGGASDDDELEIEKLVRNLRRPKNIGSRGREYEYRERHFSKVSSDTPLGAADAGGDITMGGMGATESKVSTTVQEELNTALQELALRAASEMESYDKHAESTKDYYRRALQRNAARMGSDKDAMTTTGGDAAGANLAGGKGRGILSNRNEPANIDTEALARATMEQETSTLPNSAIDASRDPRRKPIDITKATTTGRTEPAGGSTDTSKDSRRKSVDFTRDTKPGPNAPGKDFRWGTDDMLANIWKTRW